MAKQDVIVSIWAYRKEISDSLWDLVGYVSTNKDDIDFDEIKNRCENLIKTIDGYQNTIKQIEGVLKKTIKSGGRYAEG